MWWVCPLTVYLKGPWQGIKKNYNRFRAFRMNYISVPRTSVRDKLWIIWLHSSLYFEVCTFRVGCREPAFYLSLSYELLNFYTYQLEKMSYCKKRCSISNSNTSWVYKDFMILYLQQIPRIFHETKRKQNILLHTL